MKNEPINILLVEDDELDAATTKRYLSREHVDFNLQVVKDGAQALEVLFNSGEYRNSPQPDFIILDMNMPTMTGDKVIRSIKRENHLKNIPIVILSGEDLSDDQVKKFGLPKECFITKWIGMSQLKGLLKQVQIYRSTFSRSESKRTSQ